MRHKFLLSLLLCTSSLFAQNGYNFSQFGTETWSFIKQPTKWEGSDWLKLGLMGAGTFLVMQADQPIRNAVLRDRSYFNSVPITFGNVWGDWYPTAIIGGSFALHGWLNDNSSSKKIAFEIAQAGLYTEIVTQIIKNSFGRARPYKELGPTAFKPFAFLGWDFTSLPAGHTTWGFSLSTVLSRNATLSWLKVLTYLPAALTFISRIYQDHHWTSDNVLGVVISYFIATWVVDHHEQKELIVESSSGFPLTIAIPLN